MMQALTWAEMAVFTLVLEHLLYTLHVLVCILCYDLRGLWVIWSLHSSAEGSPCLWRYRSVREAVAQLVAG